MAKSIIDIDIQDERFREFMSYFQQYQQALSDMPDTWRRVGKEAGEATKGAEKLSDGAQDTTEQVTEAADQFNRIATLSNNVVINVRAAAQGQKSLTSGAERTARFFKGAADASGRLLGNVKDTATSLVRWTGILGLFTGVLGAGGLWGINRMAAGAGQQRFTAQGLNTTAGGLDASAVNFSRALANPIATLGSIRDAQSDLSKRWAFGAMGVNPNGDPANMLGPMIKNARDIYQRSGSTLQGAEAHGLTQFFTIDDLNRFKNMSDEEIDAMSRRAQADQRALQISDSTLKQWQNFNVQLDRSGSMIRSAFITGLAPLEPQLERLSTVFSEAVSQFLKSPQIGKWLDMAASGLQRLGNYLSSPKFESDVSHFMDVLGGLARAVGVAAEWIANKFGGSVTPSTDGDGIRLAPTLLGPDRNWSFGSNGLQNNDKRPIAERNHNPLNLRPASGKGFRTFSDDMEGFQAAAWQLRRYGNGKTFGYPVNTVDSIVRKWAPKEDNNDTEAYIKAVVARTGFKADQRLNTEDPAVLARLMWGMSKMENHRSNFNESAIRMVVENNTGGNAVVSSAQMANY